MVLPLRLANGDIGSGATSITIPQGSVVSDALAVSRTAGTRAAVLSISGRFQTSPRATAGTSWCGPMDLPLVVIDAESGVEIYPTELTMAEDDSDTYTVVLTMQPTADVTVTVTVPSDADVTANPSPLTFSDQNWDTPQTVTVSSTADTDTDDDEVTLTHTVSGGYTGVTADDVTVNVTETTVTANSPSVHLPQFPDRDGKLHRDHFHSGDGSGRQGLYHRVRAYRRPRPGPCSRSPPGAGRGELSFVDVPDFERPAGTSNRK